MRTLPVIPPTAPQLDDDQIVPDELVGRLYRAGENAVADLLSGLSLGDRANLAMYCYRKSHLRRTGLAIAATCDRTTLIQAWGTALGQAIFAQSRECAVDADRSPISRRPKVTLAQSAGFAPTFAAMDFDEADDLPVDDVTDDQSAVAVAAAA
jgi:hypothetical protein